MTRENAERVVDAVVKLISVIVDRRIAEHNGADWRNEDYQLTLILAAEETLTDVLEEVL